jgi:hypothetical protein
LTKGIRRDGTRMLPYPMPWTAYGSMAASDIDAIVAYLRSLPPIINRIPAPHTPNILSYLAGKFRWLILGVDPPAIVYPDNAGSAQPKSSATRGSGLPEFRGSSVRFSGSAVSGVGGSVKGGVR